MTKRSVLPQAQSESNKQQRGELVSDSPGHSHLQPIEAWVKDITKHGLMTIETQSPGTIKSIAEAAVKGQGEALNKIAATLGKLDKDGLLAIETNKPGTILKIAEAAERGQAEALNKIAAALEKLDKDGLLAIETNKPGTILEIAWAAREEYPTALNKIAAALGLLTKNEIKTILYNQHDTIECLAGAAIDGHPAAYNNMASTIGQLDISILDDDTIEAIQNAACHGYPKALNSIAETLGKLNKTDFITSVASQPSIIFTIAEAAVKGQGEALNNIAATLGLLGKDELITIATNHEDTIHMIAIAAQKGHPTALNNIAPVFGVLTKIETDDILCNQYDTIEYLAYAAIDGHPAALNNMASTIGQLDISILDDDTIEAIQNAACHGYPKASNSIAETLGKLNKTDFITNVASRPSIIFMIAQAAERGQAEALNNLAAALGLLSKSELYSRIRAWREATIECIVRAAIAGHPKVLLAILDYFFIVEEDQPDPNLPDCLYESIDEGEYGRCLSIVTVLVEIKKRYPSRFDKVCTNEFKQVIHWYNSITALETFGDTLDYIKKTVLKYNDQNTAQWSIKFFSKLIEFYEESNPIVCNESDLTVFIQKIKRYKSQYAHVIHSDKKSVESQLEDFMIPTSQHVVASISLFSASYCSLRAKYKTLVGINKSAGVLLHLEQCETLSDAHNEIVELFRHFMLCLQDDPSASQVTFCYDDIDNFLRLYDYGEAKQLVLTDLQFLDRHHPDHAHFNAYSQRCYY